MSPGRNVHGTGLVLGETGLLLRGPSGAGKSLLALMLLDSWGARGRNAVLVADDRVDLVADGDGLAMQAPAAIAGLVELRGRGIVSRPFRQAARLHLVVDLTGTLERMPAAGEFATELLGRTLVRCPVPRAGIADPGHQLLLVNEAVAALAAPETGAAK